VIDLATALSDAASLHLEAFGNQHAHVEKPLGAVGQAG